MSPGCCIPDELMAAWRTWNHRMWLFLADSLLENGCKKSDCTYASYTLLVRQHFEKSSGMMKPCSVLLKEVLTDICLIRPQTDLKLHKKTSKSNIKHHVKISLKTCRPWVWCETRCPAKVELVEPFFGAPWNESSINFRPVICFSPPVGETPLCQGIWPELIVEFMSSRASYTSSTCMVCRMLSNLMTILTDQKKIPVGRGQKPSNKTWFAQNLTCQPFPSHRAMQRYDHACGSHVCSPDPWPVGGATLRVLELRSQLRATWLIVARSDVLKFNDDISGFKLRCLYLCGWQAVGWFTIPGSIVSAPIWGHAWNVDSGGVCLLIIVFPFFFYVGLALRWLGGTVWRNFCCIRLCKHALETYCVDMERKKGGKANLFIPHIWCKGNYWFNAFCLCTIFFSFWWCNCASWAATLSSLLSGPKTHGPNEQSATCSDLNEQTDGCLVGFVCCHLVP